MSVKLEDLVTQAVLDSLAEVNDQQERSQQLPLALSTALYGSGSPVDSISLVSLIVGVEQRLQERHGMKLTIADDHAFGEKSSPFRSVGTLVEYICKRLKEIGHA